MCLGIIIVNKFLYFFLSFLWANAQIFSSVWWVLAAHQIFLELKIHSTKIERDSSVYKENYERLVVENHELKNRLKITKEQIVSHETNKNELLTALDQLNEILSKNNIVGNISPDKSSYEKKNPKKVTEAESADD